MCGWHVYCNSVMNKCQFVFSTYMQNFGSVYRLQ